MCWRKKHPALLRRHIHPDSPWLVAQSLCPTSYHLTAALPGIMDRCRTRTVHVWYCELLHMDSLQQHRYRTGLLVGVESHCFLPGPLPSIPWQPVAWVPLQVRVQKGFSFSRVLVIWMIAVLFADLFMRMTSASNLYGVIMAVISQEQVESPSYLFWKAWPVIPLYWIHWTY